MGESFNAFVKSVIEKEPEPLYNSGGVIIQRFEDTKNERPRSKEMQEAHPDLYDFLMKNGTARKFNVGIIHLDAKGEASKELASSGKSPLQIALALREMFRSELVRIAQQMKDNPDSDLGKIDFLTAASRLVSAENSVKQLGLEAFDIDESEEVKYDAGSYKWAKQTYDILSKKGTNLQDKSVVESKPEKIVLISKDALFALLEKYNIPDKQ